MKVFPLFCNFIVNISLSWVCAWKHRGKVWHLTVYVRRHSLLPVQEVVFPLCSEVESEVVIMLKRKFLSDGQTAFETPSPQPFQCPSCVWSFVLTFRNQWSDKYVHFTQPLARELAGFVLLSLNFFILNTIAVQTSATQWMCSRKDCLNSYKHLCLQTSLHDKLDELVCFEYTPSLKKSRGWMGV